MIRATILAPSFTNAGDQYHGDFRLITDPGHAAPVERMLLELPPDGAINLTDQRRLE